MKKNYEVKEGPEGISWEKYEEESIDEYRQLLNNSGDDERTFQIFFEKNPSFIPGALELIGHSGHYPYMHCLISQPEIGHLYRRKPDFLWLAKDSLNFCPVFIEIEKPNKKTFTKGGTISSEFNEAYDQLISWKGILNNPSNIQNFYEYFALPTSYRELQFKPQFLLICGRRNEFEDDAYLRNMRSQRETDDIRIMTFDRLKPLYDYRQFITCNVKQSKYIVKHIAPTYRYRADCVEELKKYKNFEESIDNMDKTSCERKDFLKQRYLYWIHSNPDQGLILVGDGE